MARGFIRKPSFWKTVGAYRSQWKRSLRRFFIPGYGRKGMGWWRNPKKRCTTGGIIEHPSVSPAHSAISHRAVPAFSPCSLVRFSVLSPSLLISQTPVSARTRSRKAEKHGQSGQLRAPKRSADRPKVPHDKNAIMLVWNGTKIGYVPKSDRMAYVSCLKLKRKVYGVITNIQTASFPTRYEFETWFDME